MKDNGCTENGSASREGGGSNSITDQPASGIRPEGEDQLLEMSGRLSRAASEIRKGVIPSDDIPDTVWEDLFPSDV